MEEVDILEYQKRELTLRYMEQSTAILATAKDEAGAKILLDAIRSEFFIGYDEAQKKKRHIAAQELIDMQNYAFNMSPTHGGGGRLEVKKNG